MFPSFALFIFKHTIYKNDEAGARKICRGFNVLHVSIIPLGVPSQVTISHLEVGPKSRHPISDQKSDFHPLGIA